MDYIIDGGPDDVDCIRLGFFMIGLSVLLFLAWYVMRKGYV